MVDSPDLSRRARKILQAVVSEYLHSGDAVGSRTVTRRHGIGLSPATVRNVMADLEDLGLLEQPHTSAGRVPTGSGLRFFIDSLLIVRSLPTREKDEIRQRLTAEEPDTVGDVLKLASRLLSDITRHAGVVLAPDPARQYLRHLEFRPLRKDRFLCILVTADGHIENRLVQLDFPIEDHRLSRIHEYLAELLGGLTLAQVKARVLREMAQEKNQYDAMVSAALALTRAAFDKPDRGAEVVVSGHANLFDSAVIAHADNVERMRELLRALEDKEIMVELLDRALDADGIQVFLGAESQVSPLGDASLVTASYGPGDQPVGAIAVIGPKRMNYGKVMSIVDFTAGVLTRLIAEP